MNGKSAAELRFEPRGLRRHDIAGIGYVHYLFHRDRIEGEGHGHLSAVHSFRQLSEAADSAYEVYSLVSPQIRDAEYLVQYQGGLDGHVQHSDRIRIIISSSLGLK